MIIFKNTKSNEKFLKKGSYFIISIFVLSFLFHKQCFCIRSKIEPKTQSVLSKPRLPEIKKEFQKIANGTKPPVLQNPKPPVVQNAKTLVYKTNQTISPSNQQILPVKQQISVVKQPIENYYFKIDTSPVWPTPNKAFFERKSMSNFIQATGSGRLESGLWGFTRKNRNGFLRFHGGIDLKAVVKRRGQVFDAIFSSFAGIVSYVNHNPSKSAYGRYVIIEHKNLSIPIYTLYAHLSSIKSGICVGKFVSAGEQIGIMGNSAACPFPKSRTHLHFEMGFILTKSASCFESWYKQEKHKISNKHGIFNGLNLVSFDPLDFFRKGLSIANFVHSFKIAYTLQINSKTIPDFVRRYPGLCTSPNISQIPEAWQVSFSWFGLPIKWVPIFSKQSKPSGHISVINYNSQEILSHKTKSFLVLNNKNIPCEIGKTLNRQIKLLFGIKKIEKL